MKKAKIQSSITWRGGLSEGGKSPTFP